MLILFLTEPRNFVLWFVMLQLLNPDSVGKSVVCTMHWHMGVVSVDAAANAGGELCVGWVRLQ